ncbi:MAG: UbiA family prenyltransferase [Verrucomicrobiota bacterium]
MSVHQTPPKYRTLLILGRTSNLPTVWSNCVTGWFLGGGGNAARLFWLFLGATLLYTGGMFLNDAFDADFDRQHRRQRPIPSSAISEHDVWLYGFLQLGVGLLLLVQLGIITAILSILLVGCILLYDAIHKLVAISPLLMAACRLFLYLVAASVADDGVQGLVVWSGLALAMYIVGLSYLARKESSRGPLNNWPCYLLAGPLLLGATVNYGDGKILPVVILFLLAAWILWCLRHIFWRPQRNIGFTVSLLLAGIPLVDWLALGGGTPLVSAIFLLLFFAALLFQRFIPAT